MTNTSQKQDDAAGSDKVAIPTESELSYWESSSEGLDLCDKRRLIKAIRILLAKEYNVEDDPKAFETFEQDVKDMLGVAILDDVIATHLWSALANVTWHNPSKMLFNVMYSFRSAGQLIAEIRGTGGYMDWYCSGPYAEVNPATIGLPLKKRGWIADTLGDVCEHPDCTKEWSTVSSKGALCWQHH